MTPSPRAAISTPIVDVSGIPDEEMLFAIRWVEYFRPVHSLAEVGDVLVGYTGPQLWSKCDDLAERGLLARGSTTYRVTEKGREAVRDYGRAMMRLGEAQEEMQV